MPTRVLLLPARRGLGKFWWETQVHRLDTEQWHISTTPLASWLLPVWTLLVTYKGRLLLVRDWRCDKGCASAVDINEKDVMPKHLFVLWGVRKIPSVKTFPRSYFLKKLASKLLQWWQIPLALNFTKNPYFENVLCHGVIHGPCSSSPKFVREAPFAINLFHNFIIHNVLATYLLHIRSWGTETIPNSCLWVAKLEAAFQEELSYFSPE